MLGDDCFSSNLGWIMFVHHERLHWMNNKITISFSRFINSQHSTSVGIMKFQTHFLVKCNMIYGAKQLWAECTTHTMDVCIRSPVQTNADADSSTFKGAIKRVPSHTQTHNCHCSIEALDAGSRRMCSENRSSNATLFLYGKRMLHYNNFLLMSEYEDLYYE